jgi:xylono-1,5-lactonase
MDSPSLPAGAEWRVARPHRHRLGEGLHWDPVAATLLWVDVLARELWRWSVQPDEAPRRWTLPERVGWALPTRAGGSGLLLGLQTGVARFDPLASAPEPMPEPPLWRPWPAGSPLRLNDAKADARGRIWAGSLNHGDESRPDGALFRIDADTAVGETVDTGYCVANGPAIHPSGTWMLHTDSVARTIYAFDLDLDRGLLSNKRVWKVLTAAEGHPDGMNFDAEGCLWLAHWGGACVSRFSDSGALLRRVAMPTSHITNVCFGGPALDRLFVTSAMAGLSDAERAAQPLAGALFELEAGGVHGLPGLPAAG